MLMTSETYRSFPGIGVDEMMTVSPALIPSLACSPDAMRTRPDMGSPWLPVVKIQTLLSRTESTSSMLICIFSGRFKYPSSVATLAMRTMLRPDRQILRLYRFASSITCWRRWIFEAKVAMIMRPLASLKYSLKVAPTLFSEIVKPGRSALVLSDMRAKTPSLPSSPNLFKSITLPSMGV